MEVSDHASQQAPSKLGLRPGQTLTVEDAIRALVTKSANDAAVVVAEAIGGDEETFATDDDAQGARARHVAHELRQRVRPAGRGAGHHRARPGHARPRDPGSLPALLPLFRDLELRLSRPRDAQPQQAARPRRGRRRHQDRLHPHVRLQSRVVGAARQPPHRRGRARRRVGRRARRAHARPDRAAHRQRLDQPHRRQDRRDDGRVRGRCARCRRRSRSRGWCARMRRSRSRAFRSRRPRSPLRSASRCPGAGDAGAGEGPAAGLGRADQSDQGEDHHGEGRRGADRIARSRW